MSIEKLLKQSRIDENRIEQLKNLFPEVVNDGKINIQRLQEEILGLDNNLIEDNTEEVYELNWTGKRESRQLAFLPNEGTLKYGNQEGISQEDTKNVFIEGDNLEVLRILQKSYSGKVKLIYIDPPYNTGTDFVYKDDYKEPLDRYLEKSGQADEEGLLTSNPKSSGRYHANWLNMMYPRLKLARNLLKDDGVIFVSIDDNEQNNLKKIMDEIFGEDNFITTIVWQKNYSPRNDAIYFSDMHEYILVYAKRKKNNKHDQRGWSRNLVPRSEKQLALYKNRDDDPRGPWKADNLTVKSYSAKYDYPITTPSGRVVNPPVNSCWRVSKEKFQELVEDNRIWFGETGNNVPALKRFISEVQDGTVPVTWWKREDYGDNQEATKELRQLFSDTGVPFETPKPVRLIKNIIQLSTQPHDNDIVLDFFAGSGTTAQAVLELNAEDKGNRRYILVQIPDKTNNEHYPDMAEVTKERIRRGIKKINEKDNNEENFDRGFKVYKLSKSNLKKWDTYNGTNIEQLEANLDMFNSAYFTEGWTPKDVVIELMLNQGFPLDSSIKKIEVGTNNSLWIVKHTDVPFDLLVCLDDELETETVQYITQTHINNTFVCLDDALTNVAKVLLSETMKVKTI
ncbi:site-specific DNA-methyltransferase [Bacillus bingmayongensis]|uniref:site-specific DNA-methyltransferase n=1 Tax=Bacillus bingmayongensis TaxID=1150157 RepID=UPI001C8E7D96|nr:site-specific DNA-methyltransferase [Bacillus bingmayongensis]MBY0596487.1 site-specific DNA-methyltransferase [Bacillus bingmayongensis]